MVKCHECCFVVMLTVRTIATDEEKQGAAVMLGRFAEYAPDFRGPITPRESVGRVLSVIDKASVEGGDGGSFVSHFGNKQWL